MRDKVTKITRSMKRITALLTLFLAMTFISCKSGKTVGENPFFAEWETPYGVPPFDKIEPEHFLPAIERGMSLHEAEIDAITSNNDAPTFENVILAYDASGKMLSQVELIFGMLCAAENTSEMQALEEQIMPRMAAHADKIRLNGKLFERIKAVYDRRAALGLDAEQSRLLEKTYRSFVRAGALLDAERKARLKAINEELSLTAVKFGQNLLAENNNYALELASSDLDGIPATARDLAREKAEAMGRKGKYVFTLHKPSLIPFLTYSSKRELREQIYKAYLNRCKKDFSTIFMPQMPIFSVSRNPSCRKDRSHLICRATTSTGITPRKKATPARQSLQNTNLFRSHAASAPQSAIPKAG